MPRRLAAVAARGGAATGRQPPPAGVGTSFHVLGTCMHMMRMKAKYRHHDGRPSCTAVSREYSAIITTSCCCLGGPAWQRCGTPIMSRGATASAITCCCLLEHVSGPGRVSESCADPFRAAGGGATRWRLPAPVAHLPRLRARPWPAPGGRRMRSYLLHLTYLLVIASRSLDQPLLRHSWAQQGVMSSAAHACQCAWHLLCHKQLRAHDAE